MVPKLSLLVRPIAVTWLSRLYRVSNFVVAPPTRRANI
jgi:hypothetical protein